MCVCMRVHGVSVRVCVRVCAYIFCMFYSGWGAACTTLLIIRSKCAHKLSNHPASTKHMYMCWYVRLCFCVHVCCCTCMSDYLLRRFKRSATLVDCSYKRAQMLANFPASHAMLSMRIYVLVRTCVLFLYFRVTTYCASLNEVLLARHSTVCWLFVTNAPTSSPIFQRVARSVFQTGAHCAHEHTANLCDDELHE